MALGKLCYAVVLLGHMYYVVLSMIIGPGRRPTVRTDPETAGISDSQAF